jgi:hypothetical protein
MHPKLEKYLGKYEKIMSDNEKAKRDKLLIEEGLYEKEYEPEGTHDENAYPMCEYGKDGKTRYYKKVAIEVTDEEFERVKVCKKQRTGYNNLVKGNGDSGDAGVAITVLAFVLLVIALSASTLVFLIMASINAGLGILIALAIAGTSIPVFIILRGFGALVSNSYNFKK